MMVPAIFLPQALNGECTVDHAQHSMKCGGPHFECVRIHRKVAQAIGTSAATVRQTYFGRSGEAELAMADHGPTTT
ncbi:hypothetical protein [Burkholderia territorii]|uniref:hypothetical protein n=1 Tax=Burkholderia territorii TaxID=1503055 RepID=UPI000A4300F5|nr:hypothetical protein [Burkholderia territorii]